MKTSFRSTSLVALTSLALGGLFLFAQAQTRDWKKGDTAPPFNARGSDGKMQSLRTLSAGKPVALYFIGWDCPANIEAEKYFARLAKAYEGKVSFVGVIDTDMAGFPTWQEKFKATYPIVFDKPKSIIKSYRVLSSPWIVLLSEDRKVHKAYAGYSGPQIQEISQEMAKLAKVPVVKIDTKGAPERLRIGCAF